MSGIENLTLWRGCARGDFTSSMFRVPAFDRAVLSWNTSGAGAALFEIEADQHWHLMGEWSARPRSFKSADVDVDTLTLKSPAASFRFRVRADSAETTLVAVAHWKAGHARAYAEAPSTAWGKILDVPQRSQMSEAKSPRDICSPTSLAMVLEYYGKNLSTHEVADGVFDHAQKIYGNWPLNTSFAHLASGLTSYVRRGAALEVLEAEIAAGRPVIIGHRWDAGELDNAPITQSNGHLIVVTGFTPSGDIVTNDPAGEPGAVRRIYKRSQLYHTWLKRASGIMYVIAP